MIEEVDIPYADGQAQKYTVEAKKTPKLKESVSERFHAIGADGAEQRDEKYTDMLARYIQNYEDNKKEIKEYRAKYFAFSLAVLIVLLLLGAALIISLFFVDFGMVGSIVAAIAAFASIISALLVIPVTITKHLFPQELDHEIVDIVKCMIENDCEIRRIESKTECLSCKHDHKK